MPVEGSTTESAEPEVQFAVARIIQRAERVEQLFPWEGHHEGKSKEFEGRWRSVEEAVAWGRNRAPRVYVDVRTECLDVPPGRYSAGEDPGDPAEGLPLWAEVVSADTPAPAKVSGYGGSAWIREIEPSLLGEDIYDVRCEREYVSGAEWSPSAAEALVVLEKQGLSLEEGLRWARARARVVVVGFADDYPRLYIWFSAGLEQPATEFLPSLYGEPES